MIIQRVEPGSAAYSQEIELRRRVLRLPLGLDFSIEDLAGEKDDWHLVAEESGRVVGCLVLTLVENGVMKMRQVAVDPEVQGQGIGTDMVRLSERVCSEAGIHKLILHARDTAVDFYLNLGYLIDGEPFEEVSLPHRRLYKFLTAPAQD